MAQQSKAIPKRSILKRIFGKPFRSYLLENKYKVEPAFELQGVKYFQFSNQDEVPTGRQFAALAIYNEMDMRCDRQFLLDFTAAMDVILNDPKKINIGIIAQLNYNLKDRLGLMVAPDFIFKLASVVFFDESESPYSYDYDYNQTKIKKWKADGDTLDFFLQTPLINLVPFLKSQENVSSIFSQMAEKVGEIHQNLITEILLEKESMAG